MAISSREFLVYADGSCLGNPGPGGWGVVVRDPNGLVTEDNGYDSATTNNRMELMAAIEGLRLTPPGAEVVLRTDSQYVVKSMTLHYKRNKNNDLWTLLDAEVAQRDVRFEWVRGHADDPTNNRADELALMGANEQLIAEGASNPKRKLSNAELLKEIATRLKRGESIRECKACGAKFLTAGDDDYCSQVRCQLESRTRQ